jgi:CRISPR/Cas system-associated exonuclease Cas4 (RecB family)
MDNINFKKDEEGYYENIETGLNFHLLCNRYFIGIDTSMGEDTKDKDKLEGWMKSLKKTIPINKDHTYLSEYTIRMAMDEVRLQANYDLIILKEDTIEIWDFKTESRKPIYRDLEKRMQTIVYMYVLMENLKLLGKTIEFSNLKMIYFNPQYEDQLIQIDYDEFKHEENHKSIKNIIDRIKEYDFQGLFDKSIYEKYCKYCEFERICEDKSGF